MVVLEPAAGLAVLFTELGSVGLDLEELPGTAPRVAINNVKEGTQAMAHPELRPGLVITHVAGRDMAGKSLDGVFDAIIDHPERPLEMRFASPDDGAGDEAGDAPAIGSAPAPGDELAPHAVDKLERMFVEVSQEPDAATLEMLAAASGSPLPAVDGWFQRRREREASMTPRLPSVDLDAALENEDVDNIAAVNRALRAESTDRLSISDASDSTVSGLSTVSEAAAADGAAPPPPPPPPEPEALLEQPEPQPEEPQEPEPEPEPDFSGTWMLAENLDMEDFLKALDLGWAKRKVAVGFADGLIGKQELSIEHRGEQLAITRKGPSNPDGIKASWVIGKADNEEEDALLGKLVTSMQWATDGDKRVLVAEHQLETPIGGSSSATTRRWIVPKDHRRAEALFVENTFNGVSMARRFECTYRPPTPKKPPRPPPAVVQAAQAAAVRKPSPTEAPAPAPVAEPEPEALPAPQKPGRAPATSSAKALRLAAADNDHPVARVALAALQSGPSFVADGWGEPTASGGSRVWKRDNSGLKVVPIKTEGVVPIDHISLRKLLVSTRLKVKMSEGSPDFMMNLGMLQKVEVCANDQCASAIVWYHQTKLPWPLQNRDMCFVNCWTSLPGPDGEPKGRQLIVEKSVEHADMPHNDDFTRMACNVLFCLDSAGPNSTKMTVCVELDPGGDLPTRVVNRLNKVYGRDLPHRLYRSPADQTAVVSAIETVTSRMRNIAEIIQTNRDLVNEILEQTSAEDTDSESTEEEEEAPSATDDADSTQGPRAVRVDMIDVGVTEAFLRPATVSQPLCVDAGPWIWGDREPVSSFWTAEHERYAESGATATVVNLKTEGKDALVDLKWLETRAKSPSQADDATEEERAAEAKKKEAELIEQLEEGVHIISTEQRKRTVFYRLVWVEADRTTHLAKRRYSEFDELRKMLAKLIGDQVKQLTFPSKAIKGTTNQRLIDDRKKGLGAFLHELMYEQQLVMPTDESTDSSAEGRTDRGARTRFMVFKFLHQELHQYVGTPEASAMPSTTPGSTPIAPLAPHDPEDKTVSVDVERWEEGRTQKGVWTTSPGAGRHVRYVLRATANGRAYEVRRRWQQISDFNTKLLKLNAGWLKEGDEWPVKKLPAAWRSPGFNAEKLEERMRSLQGYFQTFAEWATRLRSRPDKCIDLFDPEVHVRLRVVQDFFTVGAGSSDASSEAPEAEEDDLRASTAESLMEEGALLTMAKSDSAALIAKLARQRRAAALAAEKSGEEEAQEGGAAQPETGSMRLVPAAPHSPMSGTKLAAVAPQSPGAQWASSKSEEPADAEAEQGGSPGSAGSPGSPGSAASPSRHSGDEVVLTVPIAAIALLVYPPEPEPEPTPTKAPQQVAIDYEALSQEMKKLSHDFDEGGRAVVDDDDREEQQRIRNLKKTVLEDKAMVHAAVLERTASSPLTAEPEPTPEKVVLNGWQGLGVMFKAEPQLTPSYGSQPFVMYLMSFMVDGVEAFSFRRRYSQLKEVHETMEKAGCFGWNGAEVPAFPSSYPWYDMVTDPNNVELRGRELAAYYQAIIGDEGVMTHPVTARHLTFDADVVTELREQREADAKAEAEQRRREERRAEEGRVFARMMPDRCSSTVFAGWRGTTTKDVDALLAFRSVVFAENLSWECERQIRAVEAARAAKSQLAREQATRLRTASLG